MGVSYLDILQWIKIHKSSFDYLVSIIMLTIRNTICFRYQSQFENSVYICKVCADNGTPVVVTTKYTNDNQNSWFKYALSG